MNTWFAFPWALPGLIALPALLAVYWLRRRHRQLPVSALFLWNFAQPPRKGGAQMRRLPLPPVFLLELAILILLVLAAADPLLRRGDARRELLVVLDAGAAMQAPGADGSPAIEQARARLRREFRAEPWRRLRVIEARANPVLRVDATDAVQAEEQMRGFKPWAPHRDLSPALALAARLAGPADTILVATDRPPTEPPADARLRWIALGRALPNLAIVDALRGAAMDGGEVCLAEIVNWSDEPRAVVLFMDQNDRSERVAEFTLDAGGRQRVRQPVPDPERPLILRLEPADDFPLDNQTILCPEPRMPVAVAVRTRAETPLSDLLLKALAAGGRAAFAGTDETVPFIPQLVFREPDEAGHTAYPPWTVVLHHPPQARPFAGPFLRTSRHPLIEELTLDGVLWGARSDYKLPGTPLLLLADGVPLIAAERGPVLHVQWAPEQSTLQRGPDWPILIDNLLTWRAQSLPAGQPRNLPLGARAAWENPAGADATVRRPDGSAASLPTRDGVSVFEPDEPGLYRIELPDGRRFETAVHWQAPATSDLRARAAGEWGEALPPPGRALTRRSSAWFLLLAALALFAGHTALVLKGVGL
jgi:hypothetical protein